MSWKNILKQSKYPKEMNKHMFSYDEQKIKNYAKKLLKEKFPLKKGKEYVQMLEDYKKGDSFKLGEITFKIDEVDMRYDDWLSVYGIEGDMFFNNQNLGLWGVDLEPEKYKEEDKLVHSISLHYGDGYPINSDADIELYSAYYELENKI